MDDEERLEGEEEMELDEASDGEDDDEENSGIPISPANSDQLLGSAPTPSTSQCLSFHAESLNSNARDAYNITAEEVFHDPLRYQKFPLPGGKPLHIRRGPGRPRKERPPGIPRGSGMRRGFGRGLTRGKGFGYGRGMPRRTKSKDDDTHSESPSPLRIGDDVSIDGESSGLERSMPAPEEPPYFPEQWPGKVCALCNLSERSQLGQGELLKFSIPEDFTPEKNSNREETLESLVDAPVSGDKSPRASNSLGAVTCRRQKSLAKCRNPSLTNFTEPVEELTIVGYLEEPDLRIIFESTGHYYVHQACALWTSCNQEMSTEMISSAIVKASTRRCACCSHYGAGISCKVQSCNRYFHYPCAAASSCFQDVKSLSLFCSQHLGQVPLLLNGDGERIKCITCLGMGDVSNLVMCTVCGQHYHGNCVGLALLPSVRAGWQCTNCRLCQVCRQPEELAKVMTCERCDKAYHPSCLRPIVTSIPKYGWKCKCCRVCTDCGSRTPGAGLSSRWHSHYTVCDSCYQQRNKGFSCPLCRKAYRAAAYREMVQCSSCKKFVHGTCDPEADPLTYQHRKEAKPDYDYVCLHCKNVALVKRKDSVDDYGGESSLTASQESLYGDGDSSEFDYHGSSEDAFYSIGLGKGKPFCASKIAKKRLGLAGSLVGRPKGVGKLGYQKRQKMTEFGRKRGPKAKMRGIFGVPGLGLQRPISDSFSKEEEPGVENRLVLCSAKDKFVLSQDICVMCGAIGTDQEGCLIACAQCGQCYHPYCANVKVTKVILQKGWRCLDCTVCEGCGERNDEGRLILCDDCDISYHIYCMDPPLEYVPQGTWKCKWCAQCQTCGANDPGFNSNWQKNYTQCGPCASHNSCAACTEAYGEGELIIQCIQCERWLHCLCDGIKTETEAEKCAEEGYNCVLCRPRDIPPPHILCNLTKPQMSKYQQPRTPPPIIRSPEPEKPSLQQYLVEGVFLSEAGMCHIKSLMSEHQITRKKRRKLAAAAIIDTEADIMATIESVVAGGSLDNSLEDSGKLELLEAKDEPTQVYKEGMVWAPRGDLPPPEGFSIYTTENGVSVLRRKRQRNLQKLGIGGFVVRLRGTRKDKDDEIDIPGISDSLLSLGPADDKPRRKPQRRKPKTKLAECFPLYMQEAFFGRDLMDTTKDKDLDSSSDSSSERNNSGNADTIQLSRDELKAMELLKTKQEKDEEQPISEANIKREEIIKEEGSDTEALDDILPISSDLLDSDLVNTIMNEPDDDLAKATEAWDELDQAPESTKDELPDILSPHFNLESMVRDTGLSNMASQDVEEIFKGVLTDESQESRESSGYPVQAQTPQASTSSTPLVSPSPHPANIQPTNLPLGRPQVPATLPSVGQSNLNSPMSFPPPSPYHSEYSNSPFSPAFSEPPSPWVNPEDEGSASATGTAAITYNQRTSIKMEADEALGNGATTASVLYANMNHPEWKNDYPNWSERYKQIIKKWRALPGDKKAPYVSQARENRAAIRMKKVQQIPKELANTKPTTSTSAVGILTKGAVSVPPVVVMTTSQQPLSEPKDKQAPADKAMPSNPAAVVATAVAAAQAAAHAASASATAPQLAEVCAVQGGQGQRRLTSRSPSSSPNSTPPSCSPRLPSTFASNNNPVNNHRTNELASASSSSSSSSSFSSSSSSSSNSSTCSTSSCCDTVLGAGEGHRHETPPPLSQLQSHSHSHPHSQFQAQVQAQSQPQSQPQSALRTSAAPQPQAISSATNNSHQVSPSAAAATAAPARQFSSVDHQIRVLTPSEIMRTLPSLCQEHYDPPPTAIIHTVPVQSPVMEQDKLANRDRSSREAEQERQWKQLQAIRQHQAQMQQQVIHDQRAHAIARVHRQLTEDSTPTLSNENTTTMTTQLVSAPQDGTSLGQLGSGSQTQPTSRGQFAAPALKVNRGIAPPSPHPGMPGRLIGQQQQQQPATAQVGRPLPVVARAGLPVSFGQQQPPSPFSPQAPQSPHDFPQSPVPQPQPEHFQRFESAEGFGQASQNQSRSTPSYSTSPRSDGFPQPPGTPRPIFSAPAGRPTSHVYAPSRTPESYTTPQQQQQQTQPPPPPSPATPSPVSNYLSPRPEQRVDPQPAELFTQQPEVNRQLRDLLQRQQQFSKEMKPLNQAWTQDGQTATEASQQQFDSSLVQQHSQQSSNSPGEGTFRQPLPPGAARPRMPVQPNVLIRNPIGLTPRHPAVTNIDSAKLQGIDTRNRMLLQRPPVPTNVAQQFQNNQIIQQRIAGPRTQLQEHYEVLQQRFPDTNQGQNLGQRIVRTGQNTVNQGVRMISTTGMVRPPILPTVSEANVTMSETSEIPDNVTAELEKLEQEGAPMVEVENVSAILGDLADDDDELLAEMGADFNILEYADPELDQLTGGEKTNILDLDLEQDEVETKEEKQKKDIKEEEHKSKSLGTSSVADSSEVNATTMQTSTVTSNVLTQAQTMAPISQATQSAHPQAAMIPQPHPQAVVVQQQMHQHVQQAAAMGRPILPGTRLLSPDGAIGVVTSTNSVTVSYPSTFPAHPQRIPQQHLQVQQHQRMGIRVAGVTNVAGRVVSVGHMIGPRMPLAPPPPPPPYPGPPPPYPGPNQMGLCPGDRGLPRPPMHMGHSVLVAGPPMTPMIHTGASSMTPHPHRRPLLLQEQPLLLEELLEQEKREQEKQQQQQQQADTTTPNSALLSDIEFERLRADVLGSAPLSSPPQRITTPSPGVNTIRPACPPRPTVAATQNWQQPVTDPGKVVVQTQRQPISTQTATEPRIATFNIPQLPAPPVPPDNIVTEQERHVQLQYEQWLNHQHQILTQQLKYYETEVQKLRKVRKSLNSKQRQCRKSGNELPENDAAELQRISSEQAIFQKHLDTSRKQSRQHGMLIQEYRNKQQQQQQKQAQAQPQPQPQPNEPCSPLMSPSQHSSPMHSPAALMSQSPGPGMPQHSPVASIVQHSPGTMSPHSNMQPSPRIGTPHSQSEESPFSPGLCGPTVQRMASPQHRAVATSRLTTSPGSFTSEQQQIRMPQQMHILPQRFVRPTTMGDSAQRPRMQMQGGMIYGQRSPLGSPQPNQQPMMTQQQHQQMLQRQQMIQQQHEVSVISQENQNIVNQRNLQMVQRQQSLQQQQQQQQQQIMQKPPTSPMVSQPASSPSPQLHQQIQQNFNQPPSSPHPRSPMVQQTMGSPMLQQQLSQSSQPSSPMNTRVQNHPPNSPMVVQYQPPSPMSRNHPSTSPMLHQMTGAHHPPTCQTPNSPMPRSPMVGGSPMQIQRRQSTGNSPAMPDRPQSVENPGTPRTPHTPHTPHSAYSSQNSSNHSMSDQQHLQNSQNLQLIQQSQQESNLTIDQNNRGGGNPHNSNNPIPLPVLFGRYGFFKLGLRGGSPMWSSKPESSKGKTAEGQLSSSEDKPNTSSAVHRKTGISQSKINSLVCADYNDFDDDSHTPPQTPPTTLEPKAATSSITNNTIITLDSPSDKVESLPDTTDYDDDKTIINTEVTLSSTAQKDNDDIPVIEQFGDSELDVISGSLESEMQEEYVLFESDMVLSVDSNDSLSNALVNDNNEGHDLVHILEIEHPEPPNEDASFDDELLSAQTNRNKKSLHLDIVRAMPVGKRLIAVTDTPESPDQDDLSVDPSPSLYMDHSPDQDLLVSLSESDIVIIDPTSKSPDSTSKICCDEDSSETNSIGTIKFKVEPITSTTDSAIVTKSLTPVTAEIKVPEETKEKKSFTSFTFQEKFSQIPPVSLHQTIGVHGITKSISTYSSISTKTTSSYNTITASIKPLIKSTISAPTTNIMKDLLTSSAMECQKQINIPLTISSIVADAKITAKLSQSTSKCISSGTIQIGRIVSKSEDAVTKHNSTTVLTSTIMCQPLLSLPEKATTVLSSTICCQPSINLTEKLTTVSSTLPSQILQSKVSTVPKSVEKMKSNSTQKFTAQSSSATLTSSKITTAELSKQEFLNAKSADKFDSITVGNEIKKTDEIMSEILKEEKAEKLIVDSSSNTVTLQKISVLDDKKTDILNTTDELESMLEAIHNPDDENAINGDKNLNKDKTDVRTLKRMSPVADDLSLVNILENDVETVTQNDSKEISNDNVQTRKINKADKVEEQHGVAEIKPNNSGNLTSEKASMQSIVETENESNKFFIQSRISEQKAIIEESSDDILDMLQNIISSKPEMQDDKSQKSNLIYQLEAPLEALPLNILQDSLADLEQEPTSGDSESLNIEKKSLPVVKSSTFNTQQTPALSKKNLSAQTSQTLTVSTVAQLQSTTTTVPHLSPLSQPTEIKSNTDNVSDQLRTLLSSLHSTSAQSYVSGMQANLEITAPVTTAGLVSLSNSSVIPTSYRLGVTSKSDTAPKEPGSTKTRSSGAISITSNAMLNAMLSSTSSLKSSVAGGLRASTILTSSSNLLNSIVSQSSVQRPPTSSVQTVLQVSTNSSSAATVAAATAVAVSSRVLVNVTTSQQQPRSSSVSTQSTSRGLAQPVLASIANAISVTTSILQSTLSQAPTLLHTQLTAGPSQYKSAGSLPIDNKSADADSASKCISAANKSSLGKKEAEGLLVKGLSCEKGSTSRTDLEVNKTNSSLHRIEDSQNVLLKQLLQNTACATTSGTSSSTQTASFPNVPSLEDQLARPVPPTPSSLIPPLLDEIPVTKSTSTKQILSRETSFLSHAIKSQSPSSVEEPTKLTPAITSPLLTTLTKPINENFEKQQTKGTSITSQVTQQHITSVAQKQTGPSAFPLTPIEKSVTHQETVSLQSQVKTSVETTISNVVQTQQQPTQRIPTTVSGARVQVEQQQQQQQPTPSPQQSQPQLQPQQPHAQTQSQQQQQQETIIAAKAANTNETRDVMPSPSPQQSNITVGSASHPKSVSPAIQRSPGAVANIIVSATGELTKSPQQINSVQPPVPQTASIAQTLGRQAQLPQGTIAQHTVPLTEVKKEILDDVLSSGTSVQLTDTKDFLTAKEELIDGPIDDKTDLKKLKRRQYQQKRRQSQGKDASMAPQKKRSRKVSRLDEDYDTYIDNLMVQLRQLQPMAVLEPLLGKNYGVCPIFGSGDLLKFGGPVEYNTRTGDLIGSYGNARITGISDHYNTQPFGELEPFPPLPPVSTQRSFYDQEFPPLKLDDSDDKKENSLMGRDIDTPDTIVSSSSPECVIPEYVHRFPGLKLIEEESDEEADWLRRISPVIPIVSPVPIRLKPGHLKDVAKQDKENVGITRLSKSSPTTLSENGNVTVTLTLNSQAADDIMGVLKDLANILNIAPPTGYQIIERTTTPPSQKLGLYRIKGKDGKEGAPIDIQSILNGAAKFCRHCDVVILNSLIRKKVSDLPFLSKEEAEPGDELCFCSVTCYMQFALMHRTPSNIHDKAAAIVDHLCQKSDSKLLEEDLKKIQGKRFSIKQSIGQIETMDVDSIEMDLECRIKTERDELDSQHSRESFSDEKRPKKHPASEEPSNDSIVPQPPPKIWRGLRYKTWIAGAIQPTTKYKKPTDREITEMLFRLGVTVSFPLSTDDTRRCMFCQNVGDGAADGTARLLNFDVDKWVHLNCALWSEDVYETVNGALMNLDIALQSAKGTTCLLCKQSGATVKCFKIRCNSHYHLGCAVRDGCIFYKNKSTYCSQHVPKNEKDNELTTLSVYRRVYVNRDENKQVAAVMHHSDHNNLLRVGSLIFLSVGQLLPHQLANFHTANHIYPVGYKIVRFYWSMRRPNKRCRYVCSIHDVSGRPEFRVLVQEPSQEDVELRDASPRAVWNRILEPLSELRRNINSVQLFPRYVTGEDLFGLTEPAVVRVLESLPGIETLTDYRFKYGRNPLLELPLAINPSGCARTEARLKNQLPWKRPHTQRTASSARASYAPASNSSGEVACPYSKQFVHSKSSQYKKMKQDWRNNVYLARSKIQGLGLYATRDLEKHTMVIEYIGEIIRTELAETREKQYEARNRGIYMFRLDEDRVVDATLCGGLARYINHSCNPNCVAEIVEVERDLRIIIFAKRRISRGEELAYDYKFDIEDDQHKIACACGAPNCRKWMN